MDEPGTFGEWIKHRRRALHLTQEAVAQQLYCAHGTLRKIEADERRPSQELAERLARVLQVPAEHQMMFVNVARAEMALDRLALPPDPATPHARVIPSHPPTNLRLQRSSFIGRDAERAEVQALLLRRDAGLLTLSGPGGTGKTRLALEVAALLRDEFADGVWFVNLAPIVEPGLVLATIAQALEIREEAGQPLLASLKHYLSAKQFLLVLDNFEQVLPAGPLVAELLAEAPRLKVLVTSRVVLHLRDEQEYPVPPLGLPDLRQAPDVKMLGQSEAVALFLLRAQAVKPDFVVTNANASAVAAICVRLDGLPLAIELAAARVKLFSPRALLERLGNRLAFLTGGARDLPARQQTIRNTIDWSYDLLDESEKTLFARLGVFVDGCTLEAAEALCNTVTPADDELDRDVLDAVSSMVDKSMVRQVEGAAGEPRFTMLETIHEYARERLEASGSAETVRQQHAAYFLKLAEAAAPELRGVNQAAWLERLQAEHDNLRVALAWSCSRQESAELALRLAVALEEFWIHKGLYSEGDAWLERVLDHGDALIRQGAAGARALHAASGMAFYRSAFDRSRARAEEALACYRELGDRGGIAGSLFTLGGGAWQQGEYARAERFLEESLSLLRELDDTWSVGWALRILGETVLDQGDAMRAAPRLEESLFIFRSIADHKGIAAALISLGSIALIQRDAVRATALFEESLAVSHGHDATVDFTISALMGLGQVARVHGDDERAAQLYRESLELLQGDYEDNVALVECLEGLAGVAATSAAGDSRRAPRLFGAAEALRGAMTAPMPPVARADYERDVAIARTQLDDATFAAAWAKGRAMTLEQAIAYALEEADG